jgi:subfamily B ATP-binding cassette protein MsbA
MTFKSFFSKLYKYLRPHLGKLTFTSIAMIFASALESAIPEITGQIVDNLFSDDRNQGTSILYALSLFGIIILSSLFALISTATSSWVSNKVIMDLRVDLFDKLLRLPKSYFDKTPVGKTLSKVTFDVEQIAGATSTIWLEFIKSSIMVVILAIYLFYKNWQLSLTLMVLLPLIVYIVKSSSDRMRKASSGIQASMGGLSQLLNENISSNSLVKIYNAQEQERSKFHNLVTNIRHQHFKIDVTAALNAGFVNIVIGVSLASVVYLSSTLLVMSAGEFLSFFTAMAMLVKPAKNLVNMNKPLQQAIAAGESVFGFMDEFEESNIGTKSLSNVNGDISFKNVSFGYSEGAENLVLDNLSLDIKSGETVALVGPTGSGKTTIAQLITNFYSPISGSIKIDGIDIKNIQLESLRSNISFVDQNVRLFNDSIRGNIAFGSLQSLTEEDIISASKVSNSLNFISNLSDGFDTEIGENGAQLSGGQRQRISIARAIAKNSPILILDEATSALDSQTEKLVKEAIDNMQKDRTTIIIAHRLSTIKNADKIVVLDNGKIIEQGTHEELMSLSGNYFKMNS